MPFARPLPLPDSAALSRLKLGQFDTGSAPKPVPPAISQTTSGYATRKVAGAAWNEQAMPQAE